MLIGLMERLRVICKRSYLLSTNVFILLIMLRKRPLRNPSITSRIITIIQAAIGNAKRVAIDFMMGSMNKLDY